VSVNQFSVGRDISVTIVTQLGIAQFNNFTEFQSRQTKVKVKSKGIDGVVRHIWLPDGYEGSMTYDRMDPGLDNYFASEEALYYAGAPVLSATIIETITESTGAVSAFQYLGVQMEAEDLGTWKGDDKVPQKVTFAASQRMQLS
jgi:hypothetical protein